MAMRIRFSLRTLFIVTIVIGAAIPIALAIVNDLWARRIICMVGLLVAPMVLFIGTLMVFDILASHDPRERRLLKRLLLFDILYGMTLPWLVIWLLLIFFH
jgi:hypothetical protein